MWMPTEIDEPEVVLENHYGSNQPVVFCENYILNLDEQGLGRECAAIMWADRARKRLETLTPEELRKLDITWAWENILERFVPEEGWHLGYLGNNQALYSIPNGWEKNH